MNWRLLDGVPEVDVQRLLSVARSRSFEPGEVVVHKGDPADALHLIRVGRFAVKVLTPLGDTAVLTVLAPGDIFGELALLSGERRRSATVVSLERGRTYAVYHEDFARLRHDFPSVTEVLLSILVGEVERLSEQVVEALYVSADDRIVRRLNDVARVYADGDSVVTVTLTQEDLAGLAGASRATVNHVLRDAQRAGLVELARGRVRIVDPGGLERRARRPN